MKKLLTLAFMLCVCVGIHATREFAGVTAVVAPCQGVPNIIIWGEATPEQIAEAQREQQRRCDEKGGRNGTNKGSTELH